MEQGTRYGLMDGTITAASAECAWAPNDTRNTLRERQPMDTLYAPTSCVRHLGRWDNWSAYRQTIATDTRTVGALTGSCHEGLACPASAIRLDDQRCGRARLLFTTTANHTHLSVATHV